jgi:hypothetical protein
MKEEKKEMILQLKKEDREIQENIALSEAAFEKPKQKQGMLQAEYQKVGCQEPGLSRLELHKTRDGAIKFWRLIAKAEVSSHIRFLLNGLLISQWVCSSLDYIGICSYVHVEHIR